MKKYCIVSFVYNEEIQSDYHDISLDEFELLCKDAVKEAKKKGVDLYFIEVYNERIIGNSIALIEHNFDLGVDEKNRFLKFLKLFFDDWGNYASDGYETINTLKAVRFLKTDGEIIKV